MSFLSYLGLIPKNPEIKENPNSIKKQVFRFMVTTAKNNVSIYPNEKFFSTDKCYEYAKYTSREGKYPNIKYYTTNPLQYVGKYVRSERWGYGDHSGGVDIFDNNGEVVSIDLDVEGTGCFRELPCREATTPKPETATNQIPETTPKPTAESLINQNTNETSYKIKYLKYKNKYLNLKNMITPTN